MAVAAHVLDREPPPPELKRALNYRSWGVADVMTLPAGLLPRMNTVLAYYQALAGYSRAAGQKNAAEWANANPDEWEIVTRIISERKGG